MSLRSAGAPALAAAGGFALAAGIILLTGATQAQDVPGGGPSSVEVSAEGREVYEQICQACHMADAKGGGGAGTGIPALAGNPNLADTGFILDVLVKGRGGMPGFTDMLSASQIAAVTNHVRGHFNSFEGRVTEAEVKAVIAANSGGTPGCSTC